MSTWIIWLTIFQPINASFIVKIRTWHFCATIQSRLWMFHYLGWTCIIIIISVQDIRLQEICAWSALSVKQPPCVHIRVLMSSMVIYMIGLLSKKYFEHLIFVFFVFLFYVKHLCSAWKYGYSMGTISKTYLRLLHFLCSNTTNFTLQNYKILRGDALDIFGLRHYM